MSYQGLPPADVADMLLEPTERDRAAAYAIREALRQAQHWREMVGALSVQVEALQQEVTRLKTGGKRRG